MSGCAGSGSMQQQAEVSQQSHVQLGDPDLQKNMLDQLQGMLKALHLQLTHYILGLHILCSLG